MIPRTFPSTYASNGQQQMVVHFLPSVVGLERWSDYIPVKLVQGGPENSYSGTIDVAVIPSLTAQTQAWKEYIPVYLDDAGTDAWTVNAVGYIPYNYALFTDASMQLDLTNGGELDPRVTFTRTSNATVTDSTGTLVYAPHNLLTFSESFDNAAWVKARSSVTANVTMAPDGATTSDKLVEDTTASATHNLSQTFTTVANTIYTFSVYVKAAELTTIRLQLSSGGFGANVAYNFNLLNGTFTQITPGTSDSASITSLDNGWYRCSISAQATASANTTAVFFLVNSANAAVYTGDGTSGIFLWGAQLNVGSLQPYYPTTRKNLLGFTQEFDNAGWVKIRSSVSANAAIDPQGYMTADKLVENTDNSTHFIRQSPSLVGSVLHTVSVYLKAAERTEAIIRLFSSAGWAVSSSITVNLLTGSVVVDGSGATGSAVDAGNGWYRVSITQATNSTTGTKNLDIFPALGGADTYLGDGTSGIFIWGAQLSDSASLDPYVYNPGAAPAATAYFGPRFDYDPVTLAPKGLLIEEARTNSIRNSVGVGAVAGTPGTLPTNWTVASSATGPTREIVGVGIENGINYIDIRYSGTSTSSGALQISAEPTTGVAALTGQSWSVSSYVKLANGTLPGSVNWVWLERDSGGAALVFGIESLGAPTTVSLNRQRYTNTRTLLGGTSVAFVTARIDVTIPNATAIDFTLRIGLPQLEQGAFATSPILTTTAAATRAADVAVMQGANFSNWYNAVEGSLFAELQATLVSSAAAVASANDGTSNNRITVFASSATFSTGRNVAGAGVTFTPSANPVNVSGINKVAYAGANLDHALCANSGTVGTSTLYAMPVVNQLSIGNQLTANYLNGHIQRIAYFPRRLANAELTSITS
jgi:hypothetical protein